MDADVEKRVVQTILLVDDQLTLLSAWTRALKYAGYPRVFSAPDRQEAARIARRERPDVVVVDLFLPPPDTGLDVVRDLRALDPGVFIVLVSERLTVAFTMEAVRAGADECLFKSFFVQRSCWKQLIALVEDDVPVKHVLGEALTLEQAEWELITRTLIDCDNNVTHAATQLGLYRQTLQRKIRRRVPG